MRKRDTCQSVQVWSIEMVPFYLELDKVFFKVVDFLEKALIKPQRLLAVSEIGKLISCQSTHFSTLIPIWNHKLMLSDILSRTKLTVTSLAERMHNGNKVYACLQKLVWMMVWEADKEWLVIIENCSKTIWDLILDKAYWMKILLNLTLKQHMLGVIQETYITMVGMFLLKLLHQEIRKDNIKSKEHTYATKQVDWLKNTLKVT